MVASRVQTPICFKCPENKVDALGKKGVSVEGVKFIDQRPIHLQHRPVHLAPKLSISNRKYQDSFDWEQRNMQKFAEDLVAKREHADQVIYCQKNKINAKNMAGRIIVGCGGKNIRKSTISEREAMCTEFETKHNNDVAKHQACQMAFQRQIHRLMDNNLNSSRNSPDPCGNDT